jgi:CrcB protein
MIPALLIFLGGGLGSLARHGCSLFVARHFGETFPWGTFLVNVTGSLAIGLFAGLTGPEGRWLAPVHLRQFFMFGLCGGYTTFSSFSLQTLTLLENGEWLRAFANIVLSVVACLFAVWIGYALGIHLSQPRSP